jgi:hypothetical protein
MVGCTFWRCISRFVSDRGGRKVPLFANAMNNGLTYLICGLIPLPVVITGAVFISRIFGGGRFLCFMHIFWVLSDPYPEQCGRINYMLIRSSICRSSIYRTSSISDLWLVRDSLTKSSNNNCTCHNCTCLGWEDNRRPGDLNKIMV